VRLNHNWEEWILYILQGIEQVSAETLFLSRRLNILLNTSADEIKKSLPRIYSRELLDLLFSEFYTKIIYAEKKLGVSRKTASVYLAALEEKGFLMSRAIGKEKFI
jgi:Fic family protein